MNKIIRGRNNNTKKVKLLFISQVVLGVMPVLLLILFVWKKLYKSDDNRGGNNSEFNVRFTSPTVCRLTMKQNSSK